MGDPIDQAIEAAQREPRATLRFTLSSGKTVGIDLPVGCTADDVIELMLHMPGVVASANQRAASGRAITLPNGQLVPVGRQ